MIVCRDKISQKWIAWIENQNVWEECHTLIPYLKLKIPDL